MVRHHIFRRFLDVALHQDVEGVLQNLDEQNLDAVLSYFLRAVLLDVVGHLLLADVADVDLQKFQMDYFPVLLVVDVAR